MIQKIVAQFYKSRSSRWHFHTERGTENRLDRRRESHWRLFKRKSEEKTILLDNLQMCWNYTTILF